MRRYKMLVKKDERSKQFKELAHIRNVLDKIRDSLTYANDRLDNLLNTFEQKVEKIDSCSNITGGIKDLLNKPRRVK